MSLEAFNLLIAVIGIAALFTIPLKRYASAPFLAMAAGEEAPEES